MPFFDVNTLPVSRWRNGGGETREIISVPAQEGDGFAWRASVATIAQAGDCISPREQTLTAISRGS